jgi:hypothetical protein
MMLHSVPYGHPADSLSIVGWVPQLPTEQWANITARLVFDVLVTMRSELPQPRASTEVSRFHGSTTRA